MMKLRRPEPALSVRLNGLPAAILTLGTAGALQLRYGRDWLERPGAYALSAALPLREEPYDDARAAPFFAGLLPDSRQQRRLIAETFDVNEASDFSLLSAIGRDCAGAVSVVPLDTPIIPEEDVPERFEPLDEAALAKLIRELPARPLMLDDEVRLSLAGMNDKAAVLVRNKTIGLPLGGYPSSHILKPDIRDLRDSIRTEFFTLQLAARMGIKTPPAAIMTAEDQHYMLMARYDRVRIPAGPDGAMRLRRLHQEDFCQALGVMPDQKYERDGGPDWAACFQLLEGTEQPADARLDLLGRAALQYLIGNPDGHAKNYSLLHSRHGSRLAPIYDLNNARAFRDQFTKARPRLAMSIGGERDPSQLTGSHWDAFARAIGFSRQPVRRLLVDMAERLPDEAVTLRDSLRDSPAWSDRHDLVVDDIAARCADVPAMLARSAPSPIQPRPEPDAPSL